MGRPTPSSLMIRRRLINRSKASRNNKEPENGDPSRAAVPAARDVWNVVLEQFGVPQKTVYAVYFHRRGSSVYYTYDHFSSKSEAEKALDALRDDLLLPVTEFEAKHKLDSYGT